MGSQGPEFYDDEGVFETYQKRRGRPDNPNDTLEKPVLRELIGSAAGLRVVDLGCGDASIGVELLEQGARGFVGVDGSHKMAALARSVLEGSGGEVILADLQAWEPGKDVFDLAISRLALHYLPNLDMVLERIYQALVQGGRLIFSVEHPVITSCDRAWESGVRQDWIVDDYFESGARVTQWMGGEVVKYHRTVEEYFSSVQRAGFVVEHLREARPHREEFIEEETYRRRMRIPLFLFLAARKSK